MSRAKRQKPVYKIHSLSGGLSDQLDTITRTKQADREYYSIREVLSDVALVRQEQASDYAVSECFPDYYVYQDREAMDADRSGEHAICIFFDVRADGGR